MGLSDFKVQMEGDAQLLIKAIIEAEKCRAWFGNLVEDVKLLLKSFPLWSIRFIHKRQPSSLNIVYV